MRRVSGEEREKARVPSTNLQIKHAWSGRFGDVLAIGDLEEGIELVVKT
jgi:hypothetical protein